MGDKAKLAKVWQSELEERSGLVFGHMCKGELFRRIPVIECNHCRYPSITGSRLPDGRSYDWHVPEEEYIIHLLKQ